MGILRSYDFAAPLYFPASSWVLGLSSSWFLSPILLTSLAINPMLRGRNTCPDGGGVRDESARCRVNQRFVLSETERARRGGGSCFWGLLFLAGHCWGPWQRSVRVCVSFVTSRGRWAVVLWCWRWRELLTAGGHCAQPPRSAPAQWAD